MTDEPINNVPQDGRAIPIDWRTQDMSPVYANQLIVQRTAHEVVISFFHSCRPSSQEQKRNRSLNGMPWEGVRAVCVGRIAIGPVRYPDFVRVLQENLLAQPAQHEAHE